MSEQRAPMLKIGALWLETSAAGEKYLAGNFGDARMLIFANKFRTEDKQPTHIVYLAERRRQEPAEQEDAAEEVPF